MTNYPERQNDSLELDLQEMRKEIPYQIPVNDLTKTID